MDTPPTTLGNHNVRTSVGNILIPEGLLQSIGNGWSNHRPSHIAGAEDRQPLTQVIEQPARAVLAGDLLVRSRTPDYGPNGRPQIGLRRVSPTVTSNRLRHNSNLGERFRDRAASINLATLFRQREQARIHATQPSLLEADTVFRNPESILGRSFLHTTITETDPTFRKPPEDGRRPFRRLSSSSPREINHGSADQRNESLGYLRLNSLVPDADFMSVRKPTMIPQARRESLAKRLSTVVVHSLSKVVPRPRQTSIRNTYESAKLRQKRLQRSKPFQISFQYMTYLLLLTFVYFVLVGRPLWGGTVWYIYILFRDHLTFVGGSAIFVGLAFFYAFGPLLVVFEHPAPTNTLISEATRQGPRHSPANPSSLNPSDTGSLPDEKGVVGNLTTALLIPCYKSAKLLPATLDHALRIFPATSIYILANGNSPIPLDDTEEVCTRYGVNHIWIPVGSKIVAQYVGAHLIRHSFLHVLLVDDDCLLPPNFPIVTERLRGNVYCLGYTLASIGAGRSRGTWCQQAQDLEYKLSGLQRLFAGKIGSATFPHGAIVLWNTEFLIRTFKTHPGFSVSEDWFFGHVARLLGSRITMCTSVFVETETPASVFFAANGGARGGFGEMTVFKQRFKRWNFFFVNGCWYNLIYILFSWKLGFRELGTKIFVFQEVYETLLYLVTPLVLPISFFVRPAYTAYLFAGTLGLYLLNSIIFNEIHLRRSGKMVSRTMLLAYYMPFKLVLTVVNVASCWWSLWQYAKYFARRHPRIVEDPSAVGVVLKIEEEAEDNEKTTGRPQYDLPGVKGRHDEAGTSVRPGLGTVPAQQSATSTESRKMRGPRRLTVTAVKVDIIDDPTILPQVERHAYEADDSVDPLFVQTVERADSTRSRRGAATHSAPAQISSWRPQWTIDNMQVEVRDTRLLLEPVEEANELEWECSRFESVFVESLSHHNK